MSFWLLQKGYNSKECHHFCFPKDFSSLFQSCPLLTYFCINKDALSHYVNGYYQTTFTRLQNGSALSNMWIGPNFDNWMVIKFSEVYCNVTATVVLVLSPWSWGTESYFVAKLSKEPRQVPTHWSLCRWRLWHRDRSVCFDLYNFCHLKTLKILTLEAPLWKTSQLQKDGQLEKINIYSLLQ